MSIGMLVVGGILLPLAVYAFLHGQSVPLVLAVLVVGVSSFSIIASASSKKTMFVELVGLGFGGLILTLSDPHWLDPGLVIIFLAPVHFALARAKTNGKDFWLLLVSLSVFVGVCAGGWIPSLINEGSVIGWTGTAYCAAVIVLQIFAAHRLYLFGHDRERAHNTAVRHLAEQMGDGYVRFAGNSNVLFASRQTQELLGANRYELSGQGILERVHILDRPLFLKSLYDAGHNHKSKIIEARLRKDCADKTARTPEYIWVEVSFSVIDDLKTAKENWQIIALFRDVSNRKDHEVELIDARKNAEQASQTKSGFLATIGHELRTPLNAIVGFSEMMTNEIGGKLVPAHEEYANLILQSGHHLLDVVNMLLDMSKIEAGKFELQLTEFEPEDLVKPCIKMMEASAQDKGVQLAMGIAGKLPSITGDERACRQILINLLSNAIKFSHAGSQVSIRVKRQGQKLNISVADTGIGMSKDATDRVGEAFFQAHNGHSRQYEGTGLGLSIVKGLVDLHEGSIRIQSELGLGTTISVMLPIRGPQTTSVEPEIVTALATNPTNKQIGQWPEQKRAAI